MTTDEAEMLLDLFGRYRKNQRLQCQLATLDFETIKSEYRPPELGHLLDTLHQINGPALIIDTLWFIHAVNGAALRLFGLSPESPLLDRWVGWHLLAAKFRSDSPIRAVHQYTDLHYPLTVRFFFEDKLIYPYLFTLQMRLLLSKLNHLSQSHQYNFTKWWLLATKFNLPFDREPLLRTIIFDGRQVQLEAAVPHIEQEMKLNSGYRVSYRLTGWSPVNEEAAQAFKALQTFSDSRTIYLAADYDRNRSFHVNNWPEANQYIATWLRAGDC